jgi:hypothetical protein
MKPQRVTLLDELDSIPNWHRDLPLQPWSDQLWGHPTFYAREARVSFSQWDKPAGERNWELTLHLVQYGVRTNLNSKPAYVFTGRCIIKLMDNLASTHCRDTRLHTQNMMSCSSQDTEFDFRFYKEQKTAWCLLECTGNILPNRQRVVNKQRRIWREKQEAFICFKYSIMSRDVENYEIRRHAM